ncbi:uncharacterized protein Pyn_34468 [Prunus yedoensis var. nudiflora]|uniref:MBD domain-containing protein n=1 Tax=Prunus yedoensis var. nudiflora TaxID=2094558 RepID=A0A314UHI5_PRUYE|nr:uncharacterized protein Pyn_34468 [Prunus yedoensis var. nudiflora]
MANSSNRSESEEMKASLGGCSDVLLPNRAQSTQQVIPPPEGAQAVDGRFDLNLLPEEEEGDQLLVAADEPPLPDDQDQPPPAAYQDQPPVTTDQDSPPAGADQQQPPPPASNECQPPSVADQGQPPVVESGDLQRPKRGRERSGPSGSITIDIDRPDWLPPMWQASATRRLNGRTTGFVDKIYISPEGIKFRSKKQALRSITRNNGENNNL